MTTGIFRKYAPLYREKGFQPRPIRPGTKGCYMTNWQNLDDERSDEELAEMDEKHPNAGIGLVLGTPFPDGTLLGAVDIDRNDCMDVASILLGKPSCGRIGSKGIAYFVRVRGSADFFQFRVNPLDGSKPIIIGEFLGTNRLCVIPPTIHPVTKNPYQWIGKSLLETNYSELPIIEV